MTKLFVHLLNGQELKVHIVPVFLYIFTAASTSVLCFKLLFFLYFLHFLLKQLAITKISFCILHYTNVHHVHVQMFGIISHS